MTKTELADEFIEKLNEIASHDPEAMAKLISSRVSCNDQLADHPTVQVGLDDNKKHRVGLMGILNGLIGTIEKEGRYHKHGYIAAVFDDNTGKFLRFNRTDIP